jgi:isomaltose glucohydrolase
MSAAGLAARSLAVIREHQAESGAYLAAPFPPAYRYGWLRDGSFVADAMSASGGKESAEAFFSWSARIVEQRAARMESGEVLDGRFTANGEEVPGEWSARQLDGYGSWVWALGRHGRRHGVDLAPWAPAAELSLRYVAANWARPCFDWWEERKGVHTVTLAALHAGLTCGIVTDPWAGEAAAQIRQAVLADAAGGRLRATFGERRLDASLLAVATPFGLLAPDDPVIAETVSAIESALVFDNGVHRHPDDDFYGGGLWILLASLLGLHYARTGRAEQAWGQLDWVLTRATEAGLLPEQVDDHLLRPATREAWVERWGPPACPLLWSHAMFLTLALELGAVSMENAA